MCGGLQPFFYFLYSGFTRIIVCTKLFVFLVFFLKRQELSSVTQKLTLFKCTYNVESEVHFVGVQ